MTRTGAARFGAVATARTAPSAAPAVGPTRKYTVLLDGPTAETFDTDLTQIRRQTGRVVNKSDVIRELVHALHEDPTLLAAVADRLRQAVPPS